MKIVCGGDKWPEEKERQKKYIDKGMSIDLPDEVSKKKAKRHIRKPKMPARIKSMPRARQK
ncbi:MAG: hypothetical protein KAS76_01730 [Thermoplasmatales archaeon]|nr:hypothetical protein [Thermoplasmatales archaeon]MCK4995605.1 hypothetical protein [Thermoplasmatales archaeon]